MSRFRFTLDGPLRQRRNLEQLRQRELAASLKAMQDLQDELRALNDAMRQANEEMCREHMTGAINMGYLAAHRRFITSAQRKGITLMQRIALAQRETNDRRAALVEAARATKVLEKLREHQWEAFKADRNRREFAELDELGTQIAYRMTGGDAAASTADEGAR